MHPPCKDCIMNSGVKIIRIIEEWRKERTSGDVTHPCRSYNIWRRASVRRSHGGHHSNQFFRRSMRSTELGALLTRKCWFSLIDTIPDVSVMAMVDIKWNTRINDILLHNPVHLVIYLSTSYTHETLTKIYERCWLKVFLQATEVCCERRSRVLVKIISANKSLL